MKKELSEYTSEELREELRKRSIANRKKYEPKYVEFEGIIENIYSSKHLYTTDFYVSGTHPLFQGMKHQFRLKQPLFKKDTAPKIGDKVLLRYKETKRDTKYNHLFDFCNAKIIKVL